MSQAKTLKNEEFSRVLQYVAETARNPYRDCVILLLSFRAGLRVGEIAGLSWRDVTDAFGAVRDDTLSIPPGIAKKGSGRTIPMHSDLKEALMILMEAMGKENTRANDPVVRGNEMHEGSFRMKPNSLQRYISRTYAQMGLSGCSSHSGRRTFITEMARRANSFGCSLRDVQRLAGHRDLETTETYIEPSDAVAVMVGSL